MNPLARFATRPSGDKLDCKPDLILGACVKDQTFFEPGMVYEIFECLGLVTIRKIGPSCVTNIPKESAAGVSWANDVSYILDCAQGCHLWTREEYKQECQRE